MQTRLTKTEVLHLIDSGGLYGAERVVLTLLEDLKDSEFPGILGCIREKENGLPDIGREAENRGIPVRYFTMKRGLNPFGVYLISRFIRENHIRIVHSHGYKPNIFLGVIPKKNFKTVSTVHGWAKQTAGLKVRAYEVLDSLALRKMDCVVAVSKGVQWDLLRRGLRKDKIKLIYNGINFSNNRPGFEPQEMREKYGIANNAPVIGTLGRLSAVKGHASLIKAMPSILEEIRDCILLIAGDGPLKADLERLVKELNLAQSVKLIGYMKNVGEFLSMIDLFLLPSLSEGLPISLLEAMAFGKPVVASAVGGIPEVITNQNEGELVSSADPKSTSIAVSRLLKDPETLKKMGAVGSESVRKRFSSKIMTEQYSSLYSDLIPCPAK